MPEITTLVGMQVGVQPAEEGQVNLVILDPATGKQYIVPMDEAGAQLIGKGLTAPRVAQPIGGNLVLPR